MPLVSRLLSTILRVFQVICAAIVAGIIGYYIHQYYSWDNWPRARWIYTEVIAGLSILLGLIWTIPFVFSFFTWPLDFILSLAWFASFGVLVDAIHDLNCGNSRFWRGVIDAPMSVCSRWKASEAFAFISACLWAVSGILGIYFTFRVRQQTSDRYHRHGWFRHSAV